jgi:hypothetical protein
MERAGLEFSSRGSACTPFLVAPVFKEQLKMKRISIVGLCLAAVFAFSGMVASSASASGLLLARVPGGGSIVGVTFLSFANLPLLTTHGGSLIHCKDATNHGVFLSSTLGDILIRFLGCTTANPLGGERLNCSGTGAGTGEIHLPLATTLFHLGLAHLTLEVGRIPAAVILLEKNVEFTCGGLAKIVVLGSVIGALQLDEPNEKPIPLNQPVSTALLNFQQTAHGLQHLRLFLFEDELRTYDLHSTTNGGTAELSAEVALALLDLFLLPGNPPKHTTIELFEHP